MKTKLILLFIMANTLVHGQFLNQTTAEGLAKLPLDCINKEFPNKTNHSSAGKEDHVLLPSELHPSFYGCFDWHSSVHGHWMLIKLLKLYPDMDSKDQIIKVLDNSFEADKLIKEAAYFGKYPASKTFERTYGWAWTLKLDEELMTWDSPLAKKWHKNFQPLTQVIKDLWVDFFPKQTYPNRTGVHPNTAFGLAFAIDWAKAAKDSEFEQALAKKALAFYKNQKDAPAYLEPDGSDFFSPSLQIADLMHKVLPTAEYVQWFDTFLNPVSLDNLLKLPTVSDREDYQIVHLDGLSLSRAWNLKGIARNLPQNHKVKKQLESAANQFITETLPHVTSGSYGGTHWLASFAVFAIYN